MTWEDLSPEEWAESKRAAGRRKVLAIKFEEGQEDKAQTAARNMLQPSELTVAQITDFLDVSVEFVEQVKSELEE